MASRQAATSGRGPVRCVPNAGLVEFNSVPPRTPAYWTLHVEPRGVSGRLRGSVTVWSDYTVGPPQAPGLPATCATEDGFCFGDEAAFRARIIRNCFRGVARYADGTRCEFKATLDFGLGGDPPNQWRCRSPAGEPVGDGPLQVQMLRLLRCRR